MLVVRVRKTARTRDKEITTDIHAKRVVILVEGAEIPALAAHAEEIRALAKDEEKIRVHAHRERRSSGG